MQLENVQPTGLSWLRTFTRRGGACLAILALVLQFAVSFGHVHERGFAGGTAANAAGGWHKATVAMASSSGALADDDDHCPICFSNFLLATSFVPDEAQAAPRFALSEAGPAGLLAAFGISDSGKASFQSRAPPQA